MYNEYPKSQLHPDHIHPPFNRKIHQPLTNPLFASVEPRCDAREPTTTRNTTHKSERLSQPVRIQHNLNQHIQEHRQPGHVEKSIRQMHPFSNLLDHVSEEH